MKASRINLLDQIAMLEKAHISIELLEERLINLLQEIKKLARALGINQEELINMDKNSMYTLGIALAEEGDIISDLAEIADDDVRLVVERERKFGIDLPLLLNSTITPSKNKIKIPLMMSSSIASVRDQFEQLFFAYINYIEQMILIQRLGREIVKTRRQIMVLEHQVVPSLNATIAQIKLILDEREREEHVRLRKFKRSRKY